MLANACRCEAPRGHGARRIRDQVNVGVGSVKGTYDGTFKLSDKKDGEACSMRASASGAPVPWTPSPACRYATVTTAAPC